MEMILTSLVESLQVIILQGFHLARHPVPLLKIDGINLLCPGVFSNKEKEERYDRKKIFQGLIFCCKVMIFIKKSTDRAEEF